MNRRDVWMDILPSFDHAQLGLKMALLSDRFDVLVDKHFDGKTTELTIWREIRIRKDIGPKPKLFVRINDKMVEFPFPDCPLPNKIRFKDLRIDYIDYSVIEFLRSNKQIWDRMGTNLEFSIANVQQIWDIFIRQIWPIFATNIRHLGFDDGAHLDNLRRRTSPTLLTDLDQLTSVFSGCLLPDVIADDGPNATVGQALSKWLHTPSKNGQPKRLRCWSRNEPRIKEWVNNYKEAFLRATTSVSYHIQLYFFVDATMPIEPFELVNEGTNEKLIMWKNSGNNWLLKRCPIIVEKKDENWDDNLNNVKFNLWRGINCIGPLFPPAGEEKEKADESNQNYV